MPVAVMLARQPANQYSYLATRPHGAVRAPGEGVKQSCVKRKALGLHKQHLIGGLLAGEHVEGTVQRV